MPNLSAGIRITPDDTFRPMAHSGRPWATAPTGSLAIGETGEVVLSFQDVGTVVRLRQALEALEVRMELNLAITGQQDVSA